VKAPPPAAVCSSWFAFIRQFPSDRSNPYSKLLVHVFRASLLPKQLPLGRALTILNTDLTNPTDRTDSIGTNVRLVPP
jgi:hypothetical protein